MKLSFIELQGFRGARNHLRIVLPPGLLVVTGRNGSGKSTICDAVEFALTGTLTKYVGGSERGEATEQYMWWRGRASAFDNFVRLGFKGLDKEFTVTRRPGSVELDGDVSALDTELCDLRMITREPLKQLARTSLIRDESIAELSVDQEETARFAFVRTALGADGLDEAVQRNKAITAGVKRHVDAAMQEYARKRDDVTRLLADLTAARSVAQQQPDVVAADIAARELSEVVGEQTSQLLPMARQKLASWRRFSDTLLQAAGELEQIEKEKRSFTDGEMFVSLADASAQQEALTRALEEVIARRDEHLRMLREMESTETLRSRLATIYEAGRALGLRAGACPLCKTQQKEASFEQALADLAKELEGGDLAAANLRAQLRSLAAEVEHRREELDSLGAMIAGWERQRNTLNAKQTRIAASVGAEAGETSSDGIRERVGNGQVRIERLANAIAVLEASEAMDRIAALERQLNEARLSSEALQRRVEQLESAAARSKALMAGIRRAVGEVTEERLAALEPLLKDLYARLKPHAEWTELNYSVRGDLRKYLSLSVGDGINPRYTFSSGQRRAIGLAFLLAVHLSRPWCRLKTLVLDDPVQHIDDFRSLHLVDVMSAMQKAGRQIICAVEDEGLADLMCRRMATAEAGGRLVQMSYRTGEGATIARSSAIVPLTRHLLLNS
jgi:chromosome segregation protein